ncbi:MAG: type II secretion system protein [Planctomycetes bacterium]|nr:type II secretion system protein [Planctomycetota bacterium]
MNERKAGFTLVELMVVIAIIAMLATVGMATANFVIKKARQTSCGDNLKKLGEAAETYRLQMNTYPHFAGGAFWKAIYVQKGQLAEVGKDPKHYVCPATQDTNKDATGVIWDTNVAPSGVGPNECSYAGPFTATGNVKQSALLGSDDSQDDTGTTNTSDPTTQNHADAGLNTVAPGGSVKWFDNPSDPAPMMLYPGMTTAPPEMKALDSLAD